MHSDDPNARIRISRAADQSVEDIAVEKGEQRTGVKSGEYTVELLGTGDEWTFEPHSLHDAARQSEGTRKCNVCQCPNKLVDAAGLFEFKRTRS